MAFKIAKYFPSVLIQNHQKVLHSPLNISANYNSFAQRNVTTESCNKQETNNLAAVLHGIKDLRLENKPMPKIRDNQVLLQMEVVGICGSDVHYYLEGKIGPFVVKDPMVIGHEASGTVLECGQCVKQLKPGDKVAIEPQTTCRKCGFCKAGQYHLCADCHFCATPPIDGNLCRYYAHDADFCHKLADNLDFEHGTLMEPLAVAVHACKRAEIRSDDSVLIIGSGPIGLTSVLAARAFGASEIVVVDIDEFKIKKALEVGAKCAINVKGCAEKDIIKAIYEVFGNHPHKTIECSGQEQALKVGLEATKSGGKLVLVGMGTDKATLPISECVFREVDVLGVFRYVNDYPMAIEMVKTGKVDPKPLITHHFKLEDSLKAFEMAGGKSEPFVKIMIHANPKWKPADENNKCGTSK